MADGISFAKSLFSQQDAARPTSTVTATATSDESGGYITIDLDGVETEVPSAVFASEGDTVTVTIENGSPRVTGVTNGWTLYEYYDGALNVYLNKALRLGVVRMNDLAMSAATVYYYGADSQYSTSGASGLTSPLPSGTAPSVSFTAACNAYGSDHTGVMWMRTDGLIAVKTNAAVSGGKWSGQVVWTW